MEDLDFRKLGIVFPRFPSFRFVSFSFFKNVSFNNLEREDEKFVCPEKYKKNLEQDRIRAQQHRKRKQVKSQSKLSESAEQTPQLSSSSSSLDVSEDTRTQGNESAFRSKRSLHRSIKRAEKILPNSPNTLPYSVIFRKEMWSRGEGVCIFSIVSLTLHLLCEKVLREKWGWRFVKMSNLSPVVSWKKLRTVAIMWFDGQ